MRNLVFATLFALGYIATTGPAAAWDRIGQRDVRDRTDRDIIVVESVERYDRIKICVYRQPVRFYDVDVAFGNGGRQDIKVAQRVSPGDCTRVIDLEGGDRDIQSISLLYEETSFKRRTARIRIYAE